MNSCAGHMIARTKQISAFNGRSFKKYLYRSNRGTNNDYCSYCFGVLASCLSLFVGKIDRINVCVIRITGFETIVIS